MVPVINIAVLLDISTMFDPPPSPQTSEPELIEIGDLEDIMEEEEDMAVEVDAEEEEMAEEVDEEEEEVDEEEEEETAEEV